MKKRTGTKHSKYAAKVKRNGADRYGQFTNGRRLTGDIIAGTLCFAPKPEN